MKIKIIAVGKLKERYLKDGISEYNKRLSRFCDLELIEVPDEKAPENLSAAQEVQIMKKEAERIQSNIKEGSLLIILDLKGEKLDSKAFATKLGSYFLKGNSNMTFVIGGSLGLDADLLRKADLKISLSEMTFPHQLARLILMEQLYRAFKIMHNEPYHK